MNEITLFRLTMSSREIADLTGKEHKNVLADIRNMLESLGLHSADFSAQYKDPTGRTLPCFDLPKRETLNLVSGYSIPLRAKIIDRWQVLEEQAAKPVPGVQFPDFTDPRAAARAWLQSEDARATAETALCIIEDRLRQAEPKAAVAERIAAD